MRKKLGLKQWRGNSDLELLNDLLKLMQEDGADYTSTFRNLAKIELDPSTEPLGVLGLR